MADLRKPGRYLVPISFDKSPTTGYFTWHCRVEEVDENGSVQHGPVELHGTDIQALKQNYGGDHQEGKGSLVQRHCRSRLSHCKALPIRAVERRLDLLSRAAYLIRSGRTPRELAVKNMLRETAEERLARRRACRLP